MFEKRSPLYVLNYGELCSTLGQTAHFSRTQYLLYICQSTHITHCSLFLGLSIIFPEERSTGIFLNGLLPTKKYLLLSKQNEVLVSNLLMKNEFKSWCCMICSIIVAFILLVVLSTIGINCCIFFFFFTRQSWANKAMI